MTPLSFGYRVEMSLPSYEDASRLAQRAEAVGYDSVWVRDHVAVPEATKNANCLECFTTLAGMARDTKRVKLGSLVVCNHWRNPALVAKMGAMIDIMSGGRLILGIGAGASREVREFERYGWEMPAPADRVREVEESVQIIRRMWTEDAPSFDGRYHRISEAICEPKPISQPSPPILLAGAGEQLMLRVVAKHADIWNGAGAADVYRHKMDVVDRYCEEIDRDPESLIRSTNLNIVIGTTAEKARRRADQLIDENPMMARVFEHAIIGDTETVVERTNQLIEIGARWFVTYFWETNLEAQFESIEQFGQEVLPLLAETSQPAVS